MTHHGGGEEAAIAAAASAGVQHSVGAETAGWGSRLLTPEEVARREEASRKLAKMEPVGKRIDFEEGISRATVRYARGLFAFAAPGEHDLTGVSGKVIGAEIGTVLGKRGHDPAELILRVYSKGRFWPPRFPHDYIVRDRDASYTLS